jgi:hypothetical protein
VYRALRRSAMTRLPHRARRLTVVLPIGHSPAVGWFVSSRDVVLSILLTVACFSISRIVFQLLFDACLSTRITSRRRSASDRPTVKLSRAAVVDTAAESCRRTASRPSAALDADNDDDDVRCCCCTRRTVLNSLRLDDPYDCERI